MPVVKPSIRFRIFRRDDFRCVYCGASPPQTTLEVDHVVPKSRGGPNRKTNLVTACWECNRGKRDTELSLDQLQRFQPEQEPLKVQVEKREPRVSQPKASGHHVPQFLCGNFPRMVNVDAIPVATSFRYVDADTFLGVFRCASCGMVNSYEGDHCSCNRRQRERDEDLELSDYTCPSCSDEKGNMFDECCVNCFLDGLGCSEDPEIVFVDIEERPELQERLEEAIG